jgi:hypothetical protein
MSRVSYLSRGVRNDELAGDSGKSKRWRGILRIQGCLESRDNGLKRSMPGEPAVKVT